MKKFFSHPFRNMAFPFLGSLWIWYCWLPLARHDWPRWTVIPASIFGWAAMWLMMEVYYLHKEQDHP